MSMARVWHSCSLIWPGLIKKYWIRLRNDDHCKVRDMASLVNQPRFFRLLNLLVLLIVLVMRLMNNSWDDGNGEIVETIMSLQWYSCGTNSLDEPLQKNKSPCPNQLFQIPLPWLRVHVYLPVSTFGEVQCSQRISRLVWARTAASGEQALLPPSLEAAQLRPRLR